MKQFFLFFCVFCTLFLGLFSASLSNNNVPEETKRSNFPSLKNYCQFFLLNYFIKFNSKQEISKLDIPSDLKDSLIIMHDFFSNTIISSYHPFLGFEYSPDTISVDVQKKNLEIIANVKSKKAQISLYKYNVTSKISEILVALLVKYAGPDSCIDFHDLSGAFAKHQFFSSVKTSLFINCEEELIFSILNQLKDAETLIFQVEYIDNEEEFFEALSKLENLEKLTILSETMIPDEYYSKLLECKKLNSLKIYDTCHDFFSSHLLKKFSNRSINLQVIN